MNENTKDQCEDCVEEPCICDPWLNWITRTVNAGRGVVTFGKTENGHVGVWWHDAEYKERSACGDTAEDAIRGAVGREIQDHAPVVAAVLNAYEKAKHVPEELLNTRIDV